MEQAAAFCWSHSYRERIKAISDARDDRGKVSSGRADADLRPILPV
jgi:hypothetical protein